MKSIVVRENTYRLLEKLKKQVDAKSFNELLRKLAFKELGLEEDMFGIDKNRLKEFTARDRMEDREW
ncbi:MAG: hypothetical protein NDF54_08660 [archaeon GB-1867-035]|nr:hypothetical protein [Candidatus Culexmicrobium profundum]